MKRLGVLLSLTMIVVMLMCPAVYASGELEIVSISPADGQTNLQPANVAIKIRFSENMTADEALAANNNAFTILNEAGEVQPYMVLANAKKYPDELWVSIDGDLEANAEYSFTISGNLVSSDGNTLGTDHSLAFSTRNTATDNNISMLMMVGMMGAMFFFTSRETKKKAQKEAESKGIPQENLNPYKIAKDKNISLQEAVAYVEKEKAKLEKKRAELEEYDDDDDEDYDNGNYRVAKKRPIGAAGGTAPKHVLEQKAKKRAEAEKARQEKLKRDKARAKKKK